jgi:UDP-glucose 4-epimerase
LKILITGATGMIGRYLVERLASKHELVALARRDPPGWMPQGLNWIRHDLSQPFDAARLPHRIDAIAHLAQSERYREFPEGAADVFAVNVQSTFDLLEYARGAGADAFVFASTGGNYRASSRPIGEDAPLASPGPYFRSKLMAEMMIENYRDMMGGAVLRFFFVYGPGGKLLITRLGKQILAGDEIVVQGNPGMRINPIYVQDAAAAIEAALGLSELSVINVAGEQVVSLTELIDRLAAALGREPSVRHSGTSPGDLIGDTSRMKSALGITPSITLDEGLRALAESVAVGTSALG